MKRSEKTKRKKTLKRHSYQYAVLRTREQDPLAEKTKTDPIWGKKVKKL